MGRRREAQVVLSEPVGIDLPVLPPPKPNRPKVAPTIRRAVLARDKYRCRYCGSDRDLTMDHVVPLDKGGKNAIKNIVTACKDCNGRKANSVWRPRPLKSI